MITEALPLVFTNELWMVDRLWNLRTRSNLIFNCTCVIGLVMSVDYVHKVVKVVWEGLLIVYIDWESSRWTLLSFLYSTAILKLETTIICVICYCSPDKIMSELTQWLKKCLGVEIRWHTLWSCPHETGISISPSIHSFNFMRWSPKSFWSWSQINTMLKFGIKIRCWIINHVTTWLVYKVCGCCSVCCLYSPTFTD